MPRVLVVEDSQCQACDIRHILESAHFDVELAENATVALERLKTSRFDVILTDILMPGLSGYDLCRQIREDPVLEKTPVILLTVLADPMDILKGLEAGADNYIIKPCNAHILISRLTAILEPKETQQSGPINTGLEVKLFGRTISLTSQRQQVLNLFLSSLEDAFRMNMELKSSQNELAQAKAQIEKYAQHLEKQVKASGEKYAKLMEQANDAFILTNVTGTIVEANRQAETLLGRPRSFILGRPYWDFFPFETQQTIIEQFTQLKEKGTFRSEGIQVKRADNRLVPVEYNASAIQIGGECVAIFMFRDVTLQEELLQSQKMHAVGLLAGGISHDFNNVLTAILGYSDMALSESYVPPEVEECLKLILKAGERAATLTRQILIFSRKQVTTASVMNINEAVTMTQRMAQRVIGEDIDLTTKLDPDVCLIRCDHGQIDQVLMNLVVNARDAMPTGGKLQIETANVVLDERYAQEHPGAKPGPHVELKVSDTGTGINPEILGRIFEPFFTTKAEGKGTGLGLSMVYGIVTKNDGHITVESDQGTGTTFKVYLPQAVIEKPQLSMEVRMAPSPIRGETVLVVEDEEIVRILIKRVLKTAGYEVMEAGGGYEALEILNAHPVSIDLLLVDMVLPALSGPELASLIRERQPCTRVIYMSGYSNHAVFNHKTLDKTFPILQKPFAPKELLVRVRQALDLSPIERSVPCSPPFPSGPVDGRQDPS